MNIHELSTYNLADAVKFHDRLNPRLFGSDEMLLPVVRKKLLAIAADFQEFLGIDDLQLQDITVSGSNAAYSYTDHSDIDLHLVVNMPDDDVYRELFDAKKYQYNDEHNITIGGYDVELYVQDADQQHVSQGIYSVLNDEWISVPKRRRAVVDDMSVQHKYEDIGQRVEQAIDSNDLERVTATIDKVKQMRKAGLEANGEFGPENLAYKMLRKQGYIQRLFDRRNELKDQELSLNERKKKKRRTRYGVFGGYWYPGFGYAGQDHAAGSEGGGDGGGGESIREASTPDGVSATTCMFLNETADTKEVLKKFIKYVAQQLDIKKIPRIVLHNNPAWSETNTSFGRFDPETHTLHVSLPDRHILDIMRTTAHELAHCRQHEIEPLPYDAGDTGSDWENEAHAVAGIFMRDFTDQHPEFFKFDNVEAIDEGIKSKLAAAAMTAALAGGAGSAEGQTVGHAMAGALDTARTVQTLKRMGWAGAQEDLTQELKNYSRALGGDANAQNQSWLYRTQKRQGDLPQQPQPQSAAQAASDFEAYKQDYQRKKAEFDRQFQTPVKEASGYIPTKRQAGDPRFSTALTQDIRPGQVGKEANKMALKTDSQGRPKLLMKTVNLKESQLAEKLAQELAKFKDDPYQLLDPRNQRGPDNKFGMNGHVDEDYSADTPPGPESKPTMPAGTLKVDVSDVYDWYKLGQHISNMKGLGKHDFGQGAPASIISFGDEDTEHKFIQDLKRTGLDVTDIDPVDPAQPPGMKKVKTDPTYNVDEVIQIPVSKNRDAEQYYRFIMGKHKLGRPLTRQETEFVKMYNLYQKQNVAESQEQLDEVKMSPSALMQWAKSPEAQGIRAGFEAELIFRDTTNDDDDDMEMEPDYDYDERARSVQGVIDFFQGGDYGGMSQREENRLQEGLDNQYLEWMDERLYEVWSDERDELIKEAWLREKPMTERVHDYLVEGMEMDDREADRIQAAGDAAPRFTKSSDQEAYKQANPDYAIYLEAEEGAEEILQEEVEQTIEKEDGFYDEVLDEFRENFYVDDDSGFFQDIGLGYMSDIAAEYSLDWPYLTGGGGGNNGGSRDWEDIGTSLQSAIDMPVKVSSNYHSTTRKEGRWIVEPDSSLDPDDREDYGLEIVSPPLPLLDALEKLQEVTDWANNPNEGNAYTNQSTGLHMGVSVPYKGGDVDYLKLILFLGDEYVLQSFGREANTYTKSAMQKFRENIKSGRADPAGALMLMKNNLIEFAQREIQKGVGEGKYTSAHIQNGYIEFRSAGGDWLAEESADPQKLSSTMLRYARAMQIAANPAEERREYAKKLYKLVAPEGDSQLALFSQYAAGEIDKDQLKKSWAEKTIGAERKMNQRWKLYQIADGGWQPVSGAEWNGYTEDQVKNAVWSKYGREALDSGEYKLVNVGEQAWEVYNVDTGETLEIVKGKNRGEAADAVFDKYAAQKIGFNVRPYQDPATMTPRAKLAKRIAQPKAGQPVLQNYEVVDQRDVNLRVVGRFQAGTDQDAGEKYSLWLKTNGLPDDTADYGYRKAAAKPAEAEPSVAQNFDSARDSATLQTNLQGRAGQDATDVPRNWEFVNRINGQVIHNMTNASYNQANVVQTNLELRYPDADIYLRSVERPN
jgi:hypothetical protein